MFARWSDLFLLTLQTVLFMFSCSSVLVVFIIENMVTYYHKLTMSLLADLPRQEHLNLAVLLGEPTLGELLAVGGGLIECEHLLLQLGVMRCWTTSLDLYSEKLACTRLTMEYKLFLIWSVLVRVCISLYKIGAGLLHIQLDLLIRDYSRFVDSRFSLVYWELSTPPESWDSLGSSFSQTYKLTGCILI